MTAAHRWPSSPSGAGGEAERVWKLRGETCEQERTATGRNESQGLKLGTLRTGRQDMVSAGHQGLRQQRAVTLHLTPDAKPQKSKRKQSNYCLDLFCLQLCNSSKRVTTFS